MENKEQLVESLKKIAVTANEPIFTKEQVDLYKRCGLSDEEIKELERADALADVIGMLPTDEAGLNRLAAALGSISNENNPEQNLANLKIIAERDPEMLAKLMALATVKENLNN